MSATGPITLCFYRGPEGIFGKLVRVFTLSRYSHVEIRFGLISFAASPRIGVVRHFGKDYAPELWDTITVQADTRTAMDWLSARVGCRYDWSGILLSELLPFKRQANSRWYCSELACALMQAAGVMAKRRKTVSPGVLWRLMGGG